MADRNFMKIDIHAHIVPATIFSIIEKRRNEFPSVQMISSADGYSFSFSGGQKTRPVSSRLIDPAIRQAWMEKQGIDRQIVGGWLDIFGYELPAEEGALWAQMMNQELLKATIDEKSKLTALACVPLQSGPLAAKVLHEAMDKGFPGVMIGTQPKGNGGNLDDPDLYPFWEAASERNAVIFIHPMYACGDDRLLDYDLINAVGRGTDTTIAVSRLLFSGHITRYSGVKFVISHGGAALPFMLGRLERHHSLNAKTLSDPLEAFKKLYFDTVLFDPAALLFLMEKVGSDKVMMGSDFPFAIGDLEPANIISHLDLSEVDLGSILGKNAARIFNLSGCNCC